ncbi:MAG: HAD family phosphatase [Deltaproteobacteria bacterium]|nr:HAD family phosphatase [Deltaproteobacteria bacterium]
MHDFQYQAVLFDMDGVVLDSMQQHSDAWLRVMQAAGLRVEREFVLAHEGCLQTDVLEKLLNEQGVVLPSGQGAAEFMLRLLDEQRHLYLNEFAHQVVPFPGAAGLLAALAGRGVPTALVTSSRRDQVESCLPGELLRGFAYIVASDDVEKHKPHPEPYLKASQALGVAAPDCLVVENSPAGISAARAAGAVCYAVSTTLGREHLSQAHAIFDGLDDLAHFLGFNGAGE